MSWITREAVLSLGEAGEREKEMGEREIESRDITWLILAVSPILKRKEKNERKQHPSKEARAKLIDFLINKTQLSPKCCRLREGYSGFFPRDLPQSNDSFILIHARGAESAIMPQTH